MLFRPDFPFSLEIWLEPADRLNIAFGLLLLLAGVLIITYVPALTTALLPK